MKAESDTYRFDKDHKEWLDCLEKKGFAVIANVISQSKCTEIYNNMEHCLTRFGLRTFGSCIGHTNFQWELREKVAPYFAQIWQCEQSHLATSFDGFRFQRKGEEGTSSYDLHIGQSPNDKSSKIIQGQVNVCDSGEYDGGLLLYPETHTACVYQKFFGEDLVLEDDHYYRLTEPEKELIKEAKLQCIKVCAEAGDFTVWDSRLFHSFEVPSSENTCAQVRICQIPKEKVPETMLTKRKNIWVKRMSSNYHPGEGFESIPLPRTAILQEFSIREEELTDMQKSLLHVE